MYSVCRSQSVRLIKIVLAYSRAQVCVSFEMTGLVSFYILFSSRILKSLTYYLTALADTLRVAEDSTCKIEQSLSLQLRSKIATEGKNKMQTTSWTTKVTTTGTSDMLAQNCPNENATVCYWLHHM